MQLEKLALLMWKNFLLQWRHPIQTSIEILAPVIFSLLMVLLRSLIHPREHPAAFFLPFETKLSNASFKSLNTIAWSPSWHPGFEKIMNDTIKGINELYNVTKFKHKGYIDSNELDAHLTNDIGFNKIFAGIAFHTKFGENATLDSKLNVTFRFSGELREGKLLANMGLPGSDNWRTHQVFPVYYTPGVRSPRRNEGGPPSYHNEGFLMLQEQLSFSIINYFKETVNNTSFDRSAIKLYMQRFPYPKYTKDMLLTALQVFVGLLFMVSFVYSCINIVKVITVEKEQQLKEAMKIMGLPNWLHWTAWFMKSLIMLLLTIIIMVILLKAQWYPGTNYTVFTHSNSFVIFIFLLLFASATITFSFAISTLFSKANTAATFAAIAWFLSYFPYMFFQNSYGSLFLYQKLLASLCSNSAMAYGFQLIITLESRGDGTQWENIWQKTADDDFVLGHVLLMLFLDTVIYLLIAIYIETVFPGEYGVPLSWYFPFTSSYWCGTSYKNNLKECYDNDINNEYFEKEPTNLEKGIKIRQLRKVYSNKKVAVRDLSLNMYKDQITVLLGHNGAGKTTTMSMLTGMIPPSTGTALVEGYDIRTEMNGVRKSLGICPQHNILFDELTVKEHLYFYCKLKGLDNKKVDEEIEKYVNLLELFPKVNALSKTLSGGMKRKLSVAMALCANSKVVMCDEPTAGMDPSARRMLWDLLQSQKKVRCRTILLSTHFMDEADLLGDRIAIMAGGKLQCCGSSFFLKKKYGAGYHLIIDKSNECEIRQVTDLLQQYIPDLKVESNIGSELTYILNEEHSTVFESMLDKLETHSVNLGILSYGISLTTLDEVFMKVGADNGQEEAIDAIENNVYANGNFNEGFQDDAVSKNDNINVLDISSKINEVVDAKCTNLSISLLTGWALWRNRLLAMFMKRGLSIFRTWILLLIQIIIPVLFLTLNIIIGQEVASKVDLPNLRFRLDRYVDPITVLSRYTKNEYSEKYMDLIVHDNKSFINWENQNLSMKMIEETEKNLTIVNYRYISGATFNKDNSIIVWFSNQPYHSAPLSLQLVMNSILHTEVSPDYNIQMFNYPLPFTINTKFSELEHANSMGFQIAFVLGFSMAFVSSFYVMFYIRERTSKSKHLQFLSGIEVLSYWIPSFICDLLTFIVTAVCIVITLAIFQQDGFKSSIELARVFTILLCFGFAALPMMYLASYFHDTPTTGFTKMTFINIFTGTMAFITIEVLRVKELELEHIADALDWAFLLVPHYSLSTGFRNMNLLYSTHKLCNTAVETCTNITISNIINIPLPPKLCNFIICSKYDICCKITNNYFAMESPGIGRNLLFTCLIAVTFISIVLLMEYGVFEKKRKTTSLNLPSNAEEDSDVLLEKQKISESVDSGNIQNYTLAMHNVTKYYGKFLAVNNISLGVNKYECFGLLGINGAGKTTTFRIMTGDLKLSFGNAWINGYSLKTDLKKIYQLIGYCPQFDALLDDLTSLETLIIYGLLRGITLNEARLFAQQLSKQFDFHRHLDKKVKELSGGNKRKLSTALALIGDPQVIFLDEPTTGMDPATKRHLWKALCKIRDEGKCIVLTSHSIEECEALCTKLAIMVNGSFKCLGSTQRLKSKFSDGYTLSIKLKKNEDEVQQNIQMELVENFVEHNFGNVIVCEKHQELITFYISDKSQTWSKMFGIMERDKISLNIEDYSLSQSSLEQIFLTFAKQQRDK